MAVTVTARERKAFESKIAGADKVEIKITIARDDEQRVFEALEVGRQDATRRGIYFFDTLDLTLNKAGVVLRARAIEDDDDDSVVKIRPVNPDNVDDKWRDIEDFKLEADSVGDRVLMSASLKAKQKKDAIGKVVDGKNHIADLFSKKQKKFLAEFYDGAVDLDDLTILGPVEILRADIDRPGIAYELTGEYWSLPDGSKLLELSIKCPPEEAVVARQVFEAFLAGHGLDPKRRTGDQNHARPHKPGGAH
jgi:hypothetical protein